jgi:hypothetical protein
MMVVIGIEVPSVNIQGTVLTDVKATRAAVVRLTHRPEFAAEITAKVSSSRGKQMMMNRREFILDRFKSGLDHLGALLVRVGILVEIISILLVSDVVKIIAFIPLIEIGVNNGLSRETSLAITFATIRGNTAFTGERVRLSFTVAGCA